MTRRLPTTTTSPHTTTTTPSNGSSGAPLEAAMSRTHLSPSPSISTYDHTASTSQGTAGLWQPEESKDHRLPRSLATATSRNPLRAESNTVRTFDGGTIPYTLKTSVSPHTNLEAEDTATPPSHRTAEQGILYPNDPFFERAPVEYPAGSWPGATRVDDSAKRFSRTESRTANPPHPQPTNEERLTNLENVVEEQRTRLIWYQVKLDRLSTPRISSAALLRRGKHHPADTSPPRNPSPPASNAQSEIAGTATDQPKPTDMNAKLELMTQQFQASLIVAMITIALSVYDRAFMSTPHYWALCLSWLHIVFVTNPGGPRGLLGKLCDQLKALLARLQRYYDHPRTSKGVSSNPTHGAAATPNGPNTPAAIAAAATPPSPANANVKLELLTSHFQITLLTAMPLLTTLAYKLLLVWTPEYGGLVFLWLVAVLKLKPGAPRGILGRLSQQWKDLVTLLKWQGDDL
ncbi:hypothetical protein LTR10_003540 [Elasticomyces elasticus]|nr:hypothetical protein LTR10_003540 [Elasticomyces elasticus]KAK4978264.1 hypothetical protein LTR42_002642 [Elasticomyces elasticus]